jgi:hypothetical protein
MPVREIPREQWTAFLDSFSREHERWLSTVETLDAELGAHVASREKVLRGVSVDLSGEDEVIAIFLGAGAQDHAAHLVHAPSHVWLRETEEGAHEALHIESRDGMGTLLRFRSPVLAETLDGYLPDK